MAEFFDHFRHAEAFERGDFRGDQAEHGSEAVLLLEVIATEARVLVHFVGEVEVAAVFTGPRVLGVFLGQFLERRAALDLGEQRIGLAFGLLGVVGRFRLAAG